MQRGAFSVVAACTYTLSKTEAAHAAAGQSDSVNVTTQAGCAWTAASNAAWLVIDSGGSGSGSGTIQFSTQPNSGQGRSATITVQGQVLTVSQGANPARYQQFFGA